LIYLWLAGFHHYFSVWVGEPTTIQGNKACILRSDSNIH
jgi:hypothetical protein